MALLEVQNLSKTYITRMGGDKVEALRDVNFSVEAGEFIAIMGESGSGKTTLLNIIATLDTATGGRVRIKGQNTINISQRELALYRRTNLGFVFQDFNLLDNFSIRDNIYLPLVLSGEHHSEIEKKLLPLAKNLGIDGILEKHPYEISGGQKQRAAVARALITEPGLILADEPTGALDSKSSSELLTIFEKINEAGQTILMVTHSVLAASKASRVLFIKDGEIFHQIYRGNMSEKELYSNISDALTAISLGGDRVE